jgi:hypothetical protein
MNDAERSALALEVYFIAHDEVLTEAELSPFDRELVNQIYVKISEALAPTPITATEKARLVTIAEGLSDTQWNALLDFSYMTSNHGGALPGELVWTRPTMNALVARGLIEKVVDGDDYGKYRTTQLGEKVSEALD